MPKTFSSIWIHFIWTTKNRVPILHESFRYDLFRTIKKESLTQQDIYIDIINGIEDHVHSLVRLKTTQSAAQVIKYIKGASSRWVNQHVISDDNFRWQSGYGVISVSPRDIDIVRAYIYNQKQHHLKTSLKEELSRFEYYNEEKTVVK